MNRCLTICACAAALALPSCTTIQHTATTAPVETRLYNLTVADLDVSKQKAERSMEWKWNPFNSVSIAREKDNVTAELLAETGADVLVEPQFEVRRRGMFRGGSITVTGFPAKYNGFHSMTRDEAEIIAISNGTAPAGSICNPAGALTAPRAAVSRNKVKPVSIFGPEKPSGLAVLQGRAFVSVFGGAQPLDDFSDTWNFGVMFGKHGYRWSKYAKVMITHATGDVWYSGGYDTESITSACVTVGTIYRALPFVGIYGGIGLGNTFTYDYDFESKFAIPVELGLQFNIGRLNLMAGACVPMYTSFDYCNVHLSGGIGYTF